MKKKRVKESVKFWNDLRVGQLQSFVDNQMAKLENEDPVHLRKKFILALVHLDIIEQCVDVETDEIIEEVLKKVVRSMETSTYINREEKSEKNDGDGYEIMTN